MKATASSAIEIISKLSHNKHSLETFTDEEGYYNIIIGGKVSGNVTISRFAHDAWEFALEHYIKHYSTIPANCILGIKYSD